MVGTRVLSHQDLYMFDTQGFLHIPQLLNHTEILTFIDLLNTIIPHQWFDFAKADRWDNLTQLSQQFEALSIDYRLVNRAFDVINQPMRLIESYAMAYHPGGFLFMHNGNVQDTIYSDGTYAKINMAYRSDYHDGKLYTSLVKAILYLNTIHNEDEGPFCYIQGSHKANFPFPWTDFHKGKAQLLSKSSFPTLGKVMPRSGDMILLNECLLHGAMQTNIKRHILAFSYAPAFMSDWKRIDPKPNDLTTLGYYDMDDECVFFIPEQKK